MLLIGSVLHLQHFFVQLGMSGSIGNALNDLLVLKLAALQVGSLKKHLLSIGRNLTMESLEDCLGRIEIIH